MSRYLSIMAAALVVLPDCADAQARRSDALAAQWREARRDELLAERARLDAQLETLDRSVPGTPPAAVPPVAPAAALPPAGPAVPVAAATPVAPTDTGKVAEDKDKETDKDKEKDGKGSFGGLDLGVGLSLTLDIGKEDRIGSASVVNGTVRVDDRNNGRARIMLESHYFFTPCGGPFGRTGLIENECTRDEYNKVIDRTAVKWGWGPFVAIQPGSGEIIDAIGMGIMFGARREGSDQSFNLGFGIVVDPDTRVLGKGILEDRPLPDGEMEVRYRETMQTGLLVLTSFSF